MAGNITNQVDKLEDMNRTWADIYIAELRRELGDSFDIHGLTRYDHLSSIEDHFFPVRLNGNSFGIILPFRKRAYGGRSHQIGLDEDFIRFNEVLERRGYKVEYEWADAMKLVERGRAQ